MLAAQSLGLGSCWIHRAKEMYASEEGKAFLAELGVEGDVIGVGHCILGYPDGELPEAPAARRGVCSTCADCMAAADDGRRLFFYS